MGWMIYTELKKTDLPPWKDTLVIKEIRDTFREDPQQVSTWECSHFVETLRNAIDVNKPGDVFVITEVSKECQFAQRAFRERCLPEYTRHHLYRDGLARNLICGWADDIGVDWLYGEKKKKTKRKKKKEFKFKFFIEKGRREGNTKGEGEQRERGKRALTWRRRTLQSPSRALASIAFRGGRSGRTTWRCGSHCVKNAACSNALHIRKR
jgi:hypothetical protein